MHLVDLTMFYAAEGGGVSTYLNAKSAWLARQGRARHTILSPNLDADRNAARTGRAASAYLRVPSLALPGFHGYRMPLSVAAIARRLRRLQPDLVEVGDAGHCAWAALRARDRLRIPVVAFYHSDLPRLVENRFGAHAAGLTRRYLVQLYGQFDLVLAPSRLMVAQLQAMGIHGALHQPLGIDCRVFHPSRRDAAVRNALGLAPGVCLLVYAGRFTADKKLNVLLAAMERLGPGFHLLMVGPGEAAIDVPPGARVSRLPFQRDGRALARLLASCDLLVHPGDCETFGLIVLEAMGCGLPVVAANAGGLAELVDAETGVLVRPNCPASLAEAIRHAAECDLAALGANARRKVEASFGWETVFPQLLMHYCKLLPQDAAGCATPGVALDGQSFARAAYYQ